MNFTRNDSCGQNESAVSFDLNSLGYIFAEVILIVLIAFGNILVLVAFRKFHELRTTMNVFVVSLALADLTVALIALPFHLIVFVVPGIRFVFFICVVRFCIVMGSCGTSALTLSIIAVDRYLAIEKPLAYNMIMTPRRAKLISAGAWVFNYSYCCVPLFGWNEWSPCKDCISILVLPDLFITFAMLFALASIICVGIVNLKVLFTANRVSRDIQSQTVSFPGQPSKADNPRDSFVKNVRATKTLTVMFSTFAICVFPYLSFALWRVYSTDHGHLNVNPITMGLAVLFFLNSALNPVIYNQRIPEFHRAFRKLLKFKHRVGITSNT